MKRKGFTLVELLIVIVVMGILAAMMSISSSEAKLSADASNIVNKLRNIKTAAMQMYVDELDLWETTTDGKDSSDTQRFNMTEVKKFLNADNGYDGFVIVQKANNANDVYAKREWYAGYNFGDNDTKLKTKISGRVAQDDLYGSDNKTLSDNDSCTPAKPFTSSHNVVLMLIKKGN